MLEQLKAQVAQTTQVSKSAVTLIQGLAAKIEQLKTDPAQLQALADELKASGDSLAAAVAQNTPAAQEAGVTDTGAGAGSGDAGTDTGG